MSDDAQDEKTLHGRLLSGDPIVSEELASKYLPVIQTHVAARAHTHGVHDEDLINDATVEAVFSYIQHPEKFDGSKSSLLGYLKRAAERDLINLVQKDRRRRRGEELQEDVEESILARKKSSEIDTIVRGSEQEAISRIQRQRDLAGIAASSNKRDNALLRLMVEGERSTCKFAAILGVATLPIAEQRRIVKQHKDRLKVQMKRRGSKRSV